MEMIIVNDHRVDLHLFTLIETVGLLVTEPCQALAKTLSGPIGG